MQFLIDSKWFRKILFQCTTPPFPIPATTTAYLEKTHPLTIAKKYFDKFLRLKLGGQLPLEVKKISTQKRILWLYASRRNFGDAIMDLSGRFLLRDQPYEIDLLTWPNLKNLFQEDEIFAHVYADANEIAKKAYDLIIIQAFDQRSIRQKKQYFKQTPFACLHQFFYGPLYNQIDLSFHSINALFNLNHSATDLNAKAMPILFSHADTQKKMHALLSVERPVTIAIGGMEKRRTYAHWLSLLKILDAKSKPQEIILVGSDNGLAMEAEILANHFQFLTIRSFVNKLSLLETFEVIKHSALFIGCDGGLVHVANASGIPGINLFSAPETPELRITQSLPVTALFSPGEVSDITPQRLANSVYQALDKFIYWL